MDVLVKQILIIKFNVVNIDKVLLDAWVLLNKWLIVGSLSRL